MDQRRQLHVRFVPTFKVSADCTPGLNGASVTPADTWCCKAIRLARSTSKHALCVRTLHVPLDPLLEAVLQRSALKAGERPRLLSFCPVKYNTCQRGSRPPPRSVTVVLSSLQGASCTGLGFQVLSNLGRSSPILSTYLCRFCCYRGQGHVSI